MTLTYRGKQYAPAKSASSIASNKIRLTYRGVVYAKWLSQFTSSFLHRIGGGFLLHLVSNSYIGESRSYLIIVYMRNMRSYRKLLAL